MDFHTCSPLPMQLNKTGLPVLNDHQNKNPDHASTKIILNNETMLSASTFKFKKIQTHQKSLIVLGIGPKRIDNHLLFNKSKPVSFPIIVLFCYDVLSTFLPVVPVYFQYSIRRQCLHVRNFEIHIFVCDIVFNPCPNQLNRV